ncbi:MAG: hypothetical protein II889_08065, partial [Clostridia bacterium]|nr:hypothetical protein [Clostridia bacterium]
DLEAVKASRKWVSPSHFGQHVLEVCAMADIVFLALSLTLTALTAVGSFRLASSYYPVFRVEIPDLWAAAGLISYGILALLPAIIEGKEAIRWRWYLSKI